MKFNKLNNTLTLKPAEASVVLACMKAYYDDYDEYCRYNNLNEYIDFTINSLDSEDFDNIMTEANNDCRTAYGFYLITEFGFRTYEEFSEEVYQLAKQASKLLDIVENGFDNIEFEVK